MTKPNLIEQVKQALEDATPGPWTLCPSDDLTTSGIDGADGTSVVWTTAIDCLEGIQNDADAVLIALAPQMAQALIAAEEVVQAILRTKYWDAVKMEMLAYRKATDMEAE